jgi:ribonuclease BN (tRNA processing enzyme)
MQVQMSYSYFPVEMSELGAQIQYFDLKEGEFEVDGVKVQTKLMNHPILTLGYRITDGDKVFVYTGDNEPYYNFFDGADPSELEKVNAVVDEQNQGVVNFCKDADLLICDAQYTEAEYEKKRGWGHNSKTHALEIARKSGAKRMAMWHHEPVHTDKQLLEIEKDYQERAKKLGMTCDVFEAREGTTIEF